MIHIDSYSFLLTHIHVHAPTPVQWYIRLVSSRLVKSKQRKHGKAKQLHTHTHTPSLNEAEAEAGKGREGVGRREGSGEEGKEGGG